MAMCNQSNFVALARAIITQARRDAAAGCADAEEFLRAASRGEGWPGLMAELAGVAEEGGTDDAGGGR